MGRARSPVHHVHVQTKLITAAVCRKLPIKGIAFLMGHDIAGPIVTPALEELGTPPHTEAGNAPQSYSDLVTSSVVSCIKALENSVPLTNNMLSAYSEKADNEKVTPCGSDAELVRSASTGVSSRVPLPGKCVHVTQKLYLRLCRVI